MYLVSKSDISTMIIPNTVGEQKKFKILFEHFNNDDSMVVTDFDACVYDFWNISITLSHITYFWSQIVTNSTFENNASNFFILMCNYMHIQATFLNKKFERLRDSYRVFLAKLHQKMNFLIFFLHFLNWLDELIWKMVLFCLLRWNLQIVNKQLTWWKCHYWDVMPILIDFMCKDTRRA